MKTFFGDPVILCLLELNRPKSE